MKSLIVEDDFTSRLLLQQILAPYGESHIAVNGQEAVEAFKLAMQDDSPYDMISLDIMMPEMDGHETLKQIREIEKSYGITGPQEVKVIMVSALGDPHNVMDALNKGGATAYMIKPVDRTRLIEHLRTFGLI